MTKNGLIPKPRDEPISNLSLLRLLRQTSERVLLQLAEELVLPQQPEPEPCHHRNRHT